MTTELTSEAAPASRDADSVALDLTVVVPTLNEAENVPLIVDVLHKALDGKAHWEVCFVDDNSPDGTAEIAKKIAQQDPRVRCIHRIGRRGLSSACIEGALSSAADFVAVMDADLQHDESRLPIMLETARTENVQVVVGSRYVEGGGLGEWDKSRADISKFATNLAKTVTKVELSDPMSGFFLTRREVWNVLTPELSGMGFKILLDLFATSKTPLSFREVPFEFRTRQHGTSKLDNQAAWDFLMLLADKTLGKYVPVRFISFALIGGSGVLIHLGVMFVLLEVLTASFPVSKMWAVGLSIIWNFILNNIITYRDRRLKGWRWVTGLLSFAAVCALGAAADVGISTYLFDTAKEGDLFRSFWVLPALVGILIGSVWNYAVSSVYTWKGK